MGKIRDLTERKFGRLTALEDVGRGKTGNVLWRCICTCGTERIIRSGELINGHTKSCGCLRKEMLSKSRFKDLTDRRFGKLTVIEFVRINKHGVAIWRCLCDCGTEYVIGRDYLVSRGVKSCGCLRNTIKDLVRQKFGRLIVLKFKGMDKWRDSIWFCRCDCGTDITVTKSHLISGCSRSCGCFQKQRASEVHSGKNNFTWKGGITSLSHSIRTCTESLNWRLNVFARDGFMCQHCENKRNLNAHHKKPFAKVMQENNVTTLEEAKACEELWDINNGITLCKNCHRLEHKKIKHKEFDISLN